MLCGDVTDPTAEIVEDKGCQVVVRLSLLDCERSPWFDNRPIPRALGNVGVLGNKVVKRTGGWVGIVLYIPILPGNI